MSEAKSAGTTKRIGIISDTHGSLPNIVHKLFKDVDLILHAGDVGNWDIVIELETIAPVYAVYGNVDPEDVRRRLVFLREIRIDGYTLTLTHMPTKLDAIEYDKGLFRVFGHTHYAEILGNGKEWTLNPGSVSHPRSNKGPSVMILTLNGESAPKPEIIYL